MNKQEFEERTSARVTEKDYKIIECVYNYHPCISEANGKDQIAWLFKRFGIKIIYDMLPTAKKVMEIDSDISLYNGRIAELIELKNNIYRNTPEL